MKTKVFCTDLGLSVDVLIATFSLAFWKKSFSTLNDKFTLTETILNQAKYLGCHNSYTTTTTRIELMSKNTLASFLVVCSDYILK